MTATATDPGVDALRDRLREATASGAPVRLVGTGGWLDAGRPAGGGEHPVAMRPLNGITEYVAGDLTLTARAGTTLAEIGAATAEHDQWLALDPHGTDAGTIGATIATASAGPLATGFGTPRDLVLGVEFVTATGTVARGGGRVVKNVAGFDLARLLTGSWGTLGAITEVTVRLHARPPADETIVIALDDGDAGVDRVRRLLRRLPFTPYACEIVNAELARALGVGDAPAVLARLGGNAESVAAQRRALHEIGAAQDADMGIWSRLRGIEPAGSATLRISSAPSRLEAVWRAAQRIAAACPGALLHASPARGIVRCIVPGEGAGEGLSRALGEEHGFSRIGERLPAALWRAFAPPADDRLSRGIKATFDPAAVLNRGILGETS